MRNDLFYFIHGNDTISEGILFLPYWLLTYEEMLSLMLDRSDNNAPNQAMMFSNQVIKHKKDFLHGMGLEEMEANITLEFSQQSYSAR